MDNKKVVLNTSKDGIKNAESRQTQVFVLTPELLKGLLLQNKIPNINDHLINRNKAVKETKKEEKFSSSDLDPLNAAGTSKIKADKNVSSKQRQKLKNNTESSKTNQNTINNTAEQKEIESSAKNKRISFRSTKDVKELLLETDVSKNCTTRTKPKPIKQNVASGRKASKNRKQIDKTQKQDEITNVSNNKTKIESYNNDEVLIKNIELPLESCNKPINNVINKKSSNIVCLDSNDQRKIVLSTDCKIEKEKQINLPRTTISHLEIPNESLNATGETSTTLLSLENIVCSNSLEPSTIDNKTVQNYDTFFPDCQTEIEKQINIDETLLKTVISNLGTFSESINAADDKSFVVPSLGSIVYLNPNKPSRQENSSIQNNDTLLTFSEVAKDGQINIDKELSESAILNIESPNDSLNAKNEKPCTISFAENIVCLKSNEPSKIENTRQSIDTFFSDYEDELERQINIDESLLKTVISNLETFSESKNATGEKSFLEPSIANIAYLNSNEPRKTENNAIQSIDTFSPAFEVGKDRQMNLDIELSEAIISNFKISNESLNATGEIPFSRLPVEIKCEAEIEKQMNLDETSSKPTSNIDICNESSNATDTKSSTVSSVENIVGLTSNEISKIEGGAQQSIDIFFSAGEIEKAKQIDLEETSKTRSNVEICNESLNATDEKSSTVSSVENIICLKSNEPNEIKNNAKQINDTVLTVSEVQKDRQIQLDKDLSESAISNSETPYELLNATDDTFFSHCEIDEGKQIDLNKSLSKTTSHAEIHRESLNATDEKSSTISSLKNIVSLNSNKLGKTQNNTLQNNDTFFTDCKNEEDKQRTVDKALIKTAILNVEISNESLSTTDEKSSTVSDGLANMARIVKPSNTEDKLALVKKKLNINNDISNAENLSNVSTVNEKVENEKAIKLDASKTIDYTDKEKLCEEEIYRENTCLKQTELSANGHEKEHISLTNKNKNNLSENDEIIIEEIEYIVEEIIEIEDHSEHQEVSNETEILNVINQSDPKSNKSPIKNVSFTEHCEINHLTSEQNDTEANFDDCDLFILRPSKNINVYVNKKKIKNQMMTNKNHDKPDLLDSKSTILSVQDASVPISTVKRHSSRICNKTLTPNPCISELGPEEVSNSVENVTKTYKINDAAACKIKQNSCSSILRNVTKARNRSKSTNHSNLSETEIISTQTHSKSLNVNKSNLNQLKRENVRISKKIKIPTKNVVDKEENCCTTLVNRESKILNKEINEEILNQVEMSRLEDQNNTVNMNNCKDFNKRKTENEKPHAVHSQLKETEISTDITCNSLNLNTVSNVEYIDLKNTNEGKILDADTAKLSIINIEMKNSNAIAKKETQRKLVIDVNDDQQNIHSQSHKESNVSNINEKQKSIEKIPSHSSKKTILKKEKSQSMITSANMQMKDTYEKNPRITNNKVNDGVLTKNNYLLESNIKKTTTKMSRASISNRKKSINDLISDKTRITVVRTRSRSLNLDFNNKEPSLKLTLNNTNNKKEKVLPKTYGSKKYEPIIETEKQNNVLPVPMTENIFDIKINSQLSNKKSMRSSEAKHPNSEKSELKDDTNKCTEDNDKLESLSNSFIEKNVEMQNISEDSKMICQSNELKNIKNDAKTTTESFSDSVNIRPKSNSTNQNQVSMNIQLENDKSNSSWSSEIFSEGFHENFPFEENKSDLEEINESLDQINDKKVSLDKKCIAHNKKEGSQKRIIVTDKSSETLSNDCENDHSKEKRTSSIIKENQANKVSTKSILKQTSMDSYVVKKRLSESPIKKSTTTDEFAKKVSKKIENPIVKTNIDVLNTGNNNQTNADTKTTNSASIQKRKRGRPPKATTISNKNIKENSGNEYINSLSTTILVISDTKTHINEQGPEYDSNHEVNRSITTPNKKRRRSSEAVISTIKSNKEIIYEKKDPKYDLNYEVKSSTTTPIKKQEMPLDPVVSTIETNEKMSSKKIISEDGLNCKVKSSVITPYKKRGRPTKVAVSSISTNEEISGQEIISVNYLRSEVKSSILSPIKKQERHSGEVASSINTNENTLNEEINPQDTVNHETKSSIITPFKKRGRPSKAVVSSILTNEEISGKEIISSTPIRKQERLSNKVVSSINTNKKAPNEENIPQDSLNHETKISVITPIKKRGRSSKYIVSSNNTNKEISGEEIITEDTLKCEVKSPSTTPYNKRGRPSKLAVSPMDTNKEITSDEVIPGNASASEVKSLIITPIKNQERCTGEVSTLSSIRTDEKTSCEETNPQDNPNHETKSTFITPFKKRGRPSKANVSSNKINKEITSEEKITEDGFNSQIRRSVIVSNIKPGSSTAVYSPITNHQALCIEKKILADGSNDEGTSFIITQTEEQASPSKAIVSTIDNTDKITTKEIISAEGLNCEIIGSVITPIAEQGSPSKAVSSLIAKDKITSNKIIPADDLNYEVKSSVITSVKEQESPSKSDHPSNIETTDKITAKEIIPAEGLNSEMKDYIVMPIKDQVSLSKTVSSITAKNKITSREIIPADDLQCEVKSSVIISVKEQESPSTSVVSTINTMDKITTKELIPAEGLNSGMKDSIVMPIKDQESPSKTVSSITAKDKITSSKIIPADDLNCEVKSSAITSVEEQKNPSKAVLFPTINTTDEITTKELIPAENLICAIKSIVVTSVEEQGSPSKAVNSTINTMDEISTKKIVPIEDSSWEIRSSSVTSVEDQGSPSKAVVPSNTKDKITSLEISPAKDSNCEVESSIITPIKKRGRPPKKTVLSFDNSNVEITNEKSKDYSNCNIMSSNIIENKKRARTSRTFVSSNNEEITSEDGGFEDDSICEVKSSVVTQGRKRGRPAKAVGSTNNANKEVTSVDAGSEVELNCEVKDSNVTPHHRRGRPAKTAVSSIKTNESIVSEDESICKVKSPFITPIKKRGRPPKEVVSTFKTKEEIPSEEIVPENDSNREIKSSIIAPIKKRGRPSKTVISSVNINEEISSDEVPHNLSSETSCGQQRSGRLAEVEVSESTIFTNNDARKNEKKRRGRRPKSEILETCTSNDDKIQSTANEVITEKKRRGRRPKSEILETSTSMNDKIQSTANEGITNVQSGKESLNSDHVKQRRSTRLKSYTLEPTNSTEIDEKIIGENTDDFSTVENNVDDSKTWIENDSNDSFNNSTVVFENSVNDSPAVIDNNLTDTGLPHKRKRKSSLKDNVVNDEADNKIDSEFLEKNDNEIIKNSKRSVSHVKMTLADDMVDGKGLSDDSKSHSDNESDMHPRKKRKYFIGRGKKRNRGRPKGGQIKQNLDDDYVPHHSHLSRSSKQENTKLDSTVEPTESTVKKIVTCGKCNNEMLKSQWLHHNLMQHNDLGWLEGTTKPDYENDNKLLQRVLTNAHKRRRGSLICEMCNISKRSVMGYISHVTFCGKDEAEIQALMVTCPVCQAVIKPSSLEYHDRMHKEKAEAKEREKTDGLDVENVDLGPRVKRKAAEKAVTRISEFTALVKEDKDNVFPTDKKLKLNSRSINKSIKKLIQKPQLVKRISSTTLSRWKKNLDSGQNAVCSQIGCQFTSQSLDEIKHHFLLCNFTPQENFICKNCQFQSSSENEIIKHALQKHSTEDDGNSSASDGESSSSENCSETDGDNDSNKGLVKKFFFKECTETSNKMFKFIFKDGTCHTQFNKPFFSAFQWTLEFEQKNYKLSLFEEYAPNAFQLLSMEESKNYLPELDQSMQMKSKKTSNQGAIESEWKKWRRFEGQCVQDTPTFFVGGPVWAIAWLPIPTLLAVSESISQYVAISTHPTMDMEYSVGEAYPGKNIIQIWDVGNLNHTTNSTYNPKIAFAVAHEGGTVWCLDWCPSGCYEHEDVPGFNKDNNQLKRMGLLAAACSDGCVRVFSLTFPEDLGLSSENTQNTEDSENVENSEKEYPIYNTDPVLILIVNRNMYDNKQQTWQVTKLSWTKENDHNVIVAGFSNGYVALWDLTSKSPMLRFKKENTVFLNPYRHFFAHHHAVTMVYLIPQDNKRFLATASLDRMYKFWDLDDISSPKNSIKKSFVTDGTWMNHWCTALIAYDDALSLGHNYSYCLPLRDYTYKYYNILPTNSTSYTLAASDFGNSMASGTIAGEVLAMFPQQLIYIRDMEKTLPRKRYISMVSSLEVVDFQSVPEDKESLNNNTDKESSNNTEEKNPGKAPYNYMPGTYKDSKDRFGITFNDKMNVFQDLCSSKPRSHKKTLTCDMMQSVPIEQYPFMSVNRVAWNPNASSFLWLAVGYQNGFVRLSSFKAMATPIQWDKQLTAHIELLTSDVAKFESTKNADS